MKNAFTRDEVRWLLKRQIARCVNTIARMPVASNDLLCSDNDMEIMRKLRGVKPVPLSQIKGMKK